MAWNYCAKVEQPHAKAVGRSLPISHKHAREITNFVRGKSLRRAKAILEELQKKKQAIAFTRHTRDIAHRRGPMQSGRYPVKAGAEILSIIESAESNAQEKGLSSKDLYVAHIVSQRATKHWKPGRQGRRKSKSTHVEVILLEGAQEKSPKKEAKKEAPKVGKKVEPVAKKEEPKAKTEVKSEVKEAPKEAPKEKKAEEKPKEEAPAKEPKGESQ